MLLSACGTIPAATVSGKSTDRLCHSWRHLSVSKKDVLTDGTASIMEGNNAARVEWGCKRGYNRAA